MLAWIMLVGGACGLLYPLVGYPLLLAAMARWRPRPARRSPEAPLPRVSVLISAFNEARDLPRKIRSLWALDYPPELLEVLVADDGSTDGTRAALEALAAEAEAAGRLHVLPRTPNLGKPAQLNRLAEAASGEVLVCSDARQPLEPQAVRRLVAVFADPEVGGATGAVVYRTPEGEQVPVGAYWRYESRLREWEGLVDSCCTAAGPLMAVRREHVRPLPENLVLDDMLNALRVVRDGKRFVYAADACAVETFAMRRRHEFQKRVRTLAGNYQLLRFEPWLLSPFANRIWWQYVSHKVGRLLIPWCLLAMLAGSLLGWGLHPVFPVALALQVAGYLYALVGWAGAGKPWAPPGSSVAYFLVMLAGAALAGLWRDLRGRSTARWGVVEKERR